MEHENDNIPIDDELKALEAELADALRSDAPDGLADRVLSAMRPEIDKQKQFEHTLSAALTPPTPEGLADRVHAASVRHLPQAADPVAGRIGWTHRAGWRVAAVVGFVLVLAAILYQPNQIGPTFSDSDLTTIEALLSGDTLDADLGLDDFESQLYALAISDDTDPLAETDTWNNELDELLNAVDPS